MEKVEQFKEKVEAQLKLWQFGHEFVEQSEGMLAQSPSVIVRFRFKKDMVEFQKWALRQRGVYTTFASGQPMGNPPYWLTIYLQKDGGEK